MARRAEDKLSVYTSKRDFNKTPEPVADRLRPAAKQAGNRFVVQKHFATRLHFDLRLEIDGVLVSWAVTKGPTLDPKIRRLAIRTEDHPLSYGSFEGEIPKGEYGAGVVEIWDHGTYQPLQDINPPEGLADGHLKFELNGDRLRGGFALVRTKQPAATRPGRKQPAEQWLLIKEKDSTATSAFDPVETWVGSVVDPVGQKAGVSGPKPGFIKPQLATEIDRPPSGDQWVHEIKYDGYRLQAAKDGASVRLFTRAGNDWTVKMPGIREAIANLPRDRLILDGEVAVFDGDGNADFGALQNDIGSGSRRTSFIAFDCLQIGHRDLRSRPWVVRNGELRALLANAEAPLKYCDHVEGDGREIFAAAVQLGAEGIVSKHIERPWQSGRNRNWLKSKGERREVFVIGGYRTSKVRPFSSLLLGQPEGRRLIYRGRVGTGFSDKVLGSLGEQLAKLETDASPFISVSDSARDAVWVEPQLYAEVAYNDVSNDGHLRHPKFIRLSKSAPKKPETAAPSVRMTNVDRIVYPEAGLTKGDLLEYYQAVRHHLMPHIEDHFVSLIRAPDGNLEKAFFQRHEFAGMPDSIEVARNMGRYNRYICINSHDGLLAAAQFSVLEIHPWGAKRSSPQYPDRLIFDLDPDEGLPFKTVRSAARLVRDVLEAGALTSYPLLTGGKGVHVIAPLNEKANWDRVSGFAEKLAKQLAYAKPDLFVASATKSKRKGRIFLDWQRNKDKATAIAPWSPRARPGAPVACPVTWDELGRAESAAAYDITKARRRLVALKSDPWAGYWELDQTVPDL